jgi:hypothetical protein
MFWVRTFWENILFPLFFFLSVGPALTHTTRTRHDTHGAGIDIPRLMAMISPPKKEEPAPPLQRQQSNPFGGAGGGSDDNPFEDEPEDEDYVIREREKAAYERQFLMLNPQAGKLSGAQVKTALVETGVATGVLRKVWTLSDIDKDGKLDLDEFAIALRYPGRPFSSTSHLLCAACAAHDTHACAAPHQAVRDCEEVARESDSVRDASGLPGAPLQDELLHQPAVVPVVVVVVVRLVANKSFFSFNV